jgi:DNA-binding MarR family transcriptional regulator
MATSKSIRRAYDVRLEEIGLNLSEACLLAYVVERGPLTQTQVAERIGMGRAPAGAIVDNLSKRELLVRMPHEPDRGGRDRRTRERLVERALKSVVLRCIGQCHSA